MLRSSVIENVRQATNYRGIRERASDSKNAVALTFSKQISKTFKKKILPASFGSKFESKETPLYCNKRSKKIKDIDFHEKSFVYEKYFHHNFWHETTSKLQQLIIIEGKEGCGKSTFIRYYFDCFLPNLIAFLKLESADLQAFEMEVRQHLFLYINFESMISMKDIENSIYKSLREQIMIKRPNIISEQDYAMWSRIINWDIDVHKDGRDQYDTLKAYKSHFILQHYLNDHQTAFKEAIWYLGNQNSRSEQHYYISIVLDNIDLKDLDVQRKIIEIAASWITEVGFSESVWKIILPLRPETIVFCNDVINGIDYFYFPLGILIQRDLLNNRSKNLKKLIKKTSQMADVNITVKDGKRNIIVYDPITNYESLCSIENMIMFDYKNAENMPLSQSSTPDMRRLVQKFFNGNIDRFIRLRRRLLYSNVMARAIAQEEEHLYEPFPDYILITSLLTGGHDYFNKDDPENDFLNLYDTTNQMPCPYTLLIGIHAFFLLSRGTFKTKYSLLDSLTKIGYQTVEVEQCLDIFYKKGLFKRTSPDPEGDYKIIVEKDVIESYYSLVTHAAYTDNMAMVTPVEHGFLREMRHTLPLSARHFKNRTITTIQFLAQIFNDEDEIKTWRTDGRHPGDKHAFEIDFNKLCLPSIFRKAAFRYKERLEELRKNPGGLIQVMKDRDWDEIMDHDILRVDSNEIELPLKAFLP